jgi:hypothetical protein
MNFDSKSFKVKIDRAIYIKKINGNEWCEIENGKVTKSKITIDAIFFILIIVLFISKELV